MLGVVTRGISIILILCVIRYAVLYSMKKSEQNGKKRIVYVSYFFRILGLIAFIALVVMLVLLIYTPGETQTDERGTIIFYIGIPIGMLFALIIVLWQINCKIFYDDEGFRYRTIFRNIYVFEYIGIEKIKRTKGSIYLYSKGKKIKINKAYMENWQPFMELLTNRLSAFQCRQ